MVSLALWVSVEGPWPLLGAITGLAGAILFGPRGWGPSRLFGYALLSAGILVGFFAERQVASVLQDWEGYWGNRADQPKARPGVPDGGISARARALKGAYRCVAAPSGASDIFGKRQILSALG